MSKIDNELFIRRLYTDDTYGLYLHGPCMCQPRHPRFPQGWVVSVLLSSDLYSFIDPEADLPLRNAVMDDFGDLVKVPTTLPRIPSEAC